jgi:hypothetical protein
VSEKITQPLHTKNHATYQQNKTSPHKKIMQPLHQKKITQAPEKSHNLSTTKIMQPQKK